MPPDAARGCISARTAGHRFTGKTEIGQNIRTSLTQAVARLGAPIVSITLLIPTRRRRSTWACRQPDDADDEPAQLRKVAAAALQCSPTRRRAARS
jgi:hypothetical protein